MSDLSPLEDERLSALLATAQSVAAAPLTSAAPRPGRSRRALALAAVVVVGLVAAGIAISRQGTEDHRSGPVVATSVLSALSGSGSGEPASNAPQTVPPAASVDTTQAGTPPADTVTPVVTAAKATATVVPGTPDTTVSVTPVPPTVEILTGTPSEFLPGGQPWPNGLYIDAIMYMRGTVPDVRTSLDLQKRVEQILGVGNVSNEFVIDPTAAAVETVIVRLGQSVLFKSGSDEINPEFYGGFALWGGFLQGNPDVTMTVIGHTDDQGTVEYNLKLSQQRAEAARQKIIENGIDPSRVTAVSVGFEDPIATNDTSAGRALNRRIEFAVTGLFGRSGE